MMMVPWLGQAIILHSEVKRIPSALRGKVPHNSTSAALSGFFKLFCEYTVSRSLGEVGKTPIVQKCSHDIVIFVR
jgi:hypothetical protein